MISLTKKVWECHRFNVGYKLIFNLGYNRPLLSEVDDIVVANSLDVVMNSVYAIIENKTET